MEAMICPDCGEKMSSERTIQGSEVTTRFLVSECGAKFQSREKIIERLSQRLNATGRRPDAARPLPNAARKAESGALGGEGVGLVPSLFPDLPSDPSQQSGSGSRAIRRGRKDATDYPIGFLALWALAKAQGKPGNKYPAFKAYLKLNADDELNALILTRFEEWTHTDAWKRGFNQHLSTWLNQRGWEESPTPADLAGPKIARPGANGSAAGPRQSTRDVFANLLAPKAQP